jgi:RHS repeat-associated protein
VSASRKSGWHSLFAFRTNAAKTRSNRVFARVVSLGADPTLLLSCPLSRHCVQQAWAILLPVKFGILVVVFVSTPLKNPHDPRCSLNERLSNRSVHGDGLSSTQLVTDDTGAQAARIVYGAWGEQLSVNDSVPGGLDVRFVGGLGVRNDSASGLIYMRHRWYDASLGRFISRDPIGFEGGYNLYQYCGNNPAGAIDPSGLGPFSWRIRFPRYKLHRKGECAELLKRIREAHNQVCQKTQELLQDYDGLRGTHPDDFAKPSLSVRGHEWKRRKEELRLTLLIFEYTLHCTRFGPPPVLEPVPVYVYNYGPGPRNLPTTTQQPPSTPDLGPWITTVGVGTALYWIVSEGTRLFPARNLVPVP